MAGEPELHKPRWRRAIPWAIAVLGITLAAWLLWRTLGRYDYAQLRAAVAAVPRHNLLLAGAFAAASYLCLTGFDFLATRYAGSRLPYHRVALASFTSLSLGHNIGFAALSSGAVRYRFYSRWGLDGLAVARIIVFCAVTAGIGLLVLASAALLLQPDLASEVTGLGRGAAIALGGACATLPFLYLALAAFMRRPIAWRRWSVEMPRLHLALGQVLIGPLNFACVAACLHQALLGAADLPYLAVASAYVIANVATLVTHVPGGLGVIESVVQYLLPQADLIGALLVFRFVYFLVPLCLGGLSFAAAEIWNGMGRASGRQRGAVNPA